MNEAIAPTPPRWQEFTLRATYTGAMFSLSDPQPGTIHPLDILVPLSRIQRWNGHTAVPYTVGQHVWLVAMNTPRPLRLAALLHDAAEAYTGDASRPLRSLLGRAFDDVDERISRAIATRFGLADIFPPEVRAIDNRVLATELRDVMPPQGFTIDAEPLPNRIVPWPHRAVLPRLVTLFEQLSGEFIDRRLLPMSRKAWIETRLLPQV